MEDKSVLDLINDAIEILRKSTTFFKIVIEGKKTNIIIEKPKEDDKRKEIS